MVRNGPRPDWCFTWWPSKLFDFPSCDESGKGRGGPFCRPRECRQRSGWLVRWASGPSSRHMSSLTKKKLDWICFDVRLRGPWNWTLSSCRARPFLFVWFSLFLSFLSRERNKDINSLWHNPAWVNRMVPQNKPVIILLELRFFAVVKKSSLSTTHPLVIIILVRWFLFINIFHSRFCYFGLPYRRSLLYIKPILFCPIFSSIFFPLIFCNDCNNEPAT